MKTFSVYSLQCLLKQNILGIKVVGITSNKFNGLNLTSIN
jgi:hypothetical protein